MFEQLTEKEINELDRYSELIFSQRNYFPKYPNHLIPVMFNLQKNIYRQTDFINIAEFNYNKFDDSDAKLFLKDFVSKDFINQELIGTTHEAVHELFRQEYLDNIKTKVLDSADDLLFLYLFVSQDSQKKFLDFISPNYLYEASKKIMRPSKSSFNQEDEELKKLFHKQTIARAPQQSIEELVKTDFLFIEGTQNALNMPFDLLINSTERISYMPKVFFEETINKIHNIENETKEDIKNVTDLAVFKNIAKNRLSQYLEVYKEIENAEYFYGTVAEKIYMFGYAEEEILKNQNLIKYFAQAKDRLNKSSEKKSFHGNYSLKPVFKNLTDEIINLNISNYFLEKEEANTNNEFLNNILDKINDLKDDATLIKQLTQISKEIPIYKRDINMYLAEFLKNGTDALKNKDHTNFVSACMHCLENLREENNKFEKTINLPKIASDSQININPFLFFEYTSENLNELIDAEYSKFAFDELKELKTIQTIKKRVSELKKDKTLIQGLSELENTLINKIDFLRNINKEKMIEYIENTDVINLELMADFKFSNSFSLYKLTNPRDIDFFNDCIDLKGKYELQGLTLHNNTSSLVAKIQYKTDSFQSKKFNNIVLARAFLYDVEVDNQKGLFLAGLSGFTPNNFTNMSLDKINSWEIAMHSMIEQYAKLNQYENIYMNMQPLGDVRTPSTKYNHDFVKFIADKANMPEEHYTFEKIGSGRKPRFFEIKPEYKEQYVQEINITRDADLIGNFYIEGMYTNKEDAIRTRIARKPQHEDFKPEFIYDRGYAPIIKIKL